MSDFVIHSQGPWPFWTLRRNRKAVMKHLSQQPGETPFNLKETVLSLWMIKLQFHKLSQHKVTPKPNPAISSYSPWKVAYNSLLHQSWPCNPAPSFVSDSCWVLVEPIQLMNPAEYNCPFLLDVFSARSMKWINSQSGLMSPTAGTR